MKLRDLFVEFKVKNEPRDEVHYRQLKKDLQKIQNDPKQRDPETKRAVMKRKAELDAWAHSKGIKSENSIEEEPVSMQDLKRVGADVKKVYVHKDGKTILVPVEKKDEYLAKGYKLSSLRAEDQVDERMPASIIKHKEKLANMSDKDLADRFKDFDDTRLRQMAWRHGYGKMSDYYVNRKNKGMSQDTNEGEMRMDKSAFVQMLANKIQEPQKGHGRPEYDNRLLAKMYKLVTGKDVDFEGDKFTIKMNTPTTEDAGGKEGFDYPQGGKYGYKAERGSGTGAMGTMQVNVTIHNRETDETMYIKDMNYLELEKGDEQETLAMIWDENRDLIQKESAVPEDADIDAQFKSDVLQFLNSKVVQIEKQIELQPANTAEEKENKEFALKLFDFVQAKLEQKDDADNTLTVPKSMIKKK